MLLHKVYLTFSVTFAFGKVGNADKKLKIHIYQVDLFFKWLKETMKNSYGVDKYINKLFMWITEFPELFLNSTPLSMDQKNRIAQLLITDYVWPNYPWLCCYCKYSFIIIY